MTDPESTIDYSQKPDAGVGDDVAAGDAAGQQAKQADDAEKQSADASGPDLSFLKDELRSRLEGHLDADTAEELRKGYLREDYFTKKRQEDAKARTDALALAAQYEERAKKWENLEADPALQEHLLNFYNQSETAKPAAPVGVPDDLFELSPAEFVAAIHAAAPRDTPPVISAQSIKEEILREAQAPLVHRQQLATAAEEWGVPNGVSAEIMTAAATMMAEDHDGADNLTPAMVTRLMPTYTDLVKSRAAVASDQSTQQLAEQARAASPRGGFGTASPDRPTAQQEYDALREKLGHEPDSGAAMKIFYRNMMEARAAAEGKPVSELEREYESRWDQR